MTISQLESCVRATAVALILFASGLAHAQKEGLPSLYRQDKSVLVDLEKQASLAEPETSDKQELCIYFHKCGMANSKLGRYEQAIGDLKQALSLNQPSRLSPGDWCDRWRIQNSLSGLYLAAGDHFARIEHLQAVGAELRDTNSRLYLLTKLGMIDPYVALGMLKDAEEAFRSASEALPQARMRAEWAIQEYNVMDLYNRYSAWLQELRGNYAVGERFRRDALDNAKQYLKTSLAISRNNPNEKGIAAGNLTSTMYQLASNLSTQGKLGEAEYLAHEALGRTLSESSFSTVGTSNALSVLGAIQLQQGKTAEAARYVELAIQALEQSSVKTYSTTLAKRRSQIGLTRVMQGRWSDALNVFEARDQGLRSSPEQFAKFGSRNLDWAMALLKTGQAAKSADMLQRLVDFNLKKPFVDPLYVAYLRGYLAAALAEQGQRSKAMHEFQAAIPVVLEQARENAGNEDSGFVKVYRMRLILEAYLDFLAASPRAGQQIPGLDLATETFKIADIARNSSVQRAVTASAARATIPDPNLSDLARREQDGANRILALNKILLRLAVAPEGQRLQKAIDDLQLEIARLAGEQIKLRKEIAGRFPDYANLVDPRPATPADLQRVLQHDEAAIAIYSSERQSFVWTITKQTVSFRVVPVTREELAQDVAAVRRSIDLSDGEIKDFDFAAAYRVYSLFLGPDFDKWSTAKLINVIPHGPLGQMPFAMLLTEPVKPMKKAVPAYAAMPWLISKVAIAQQASASGFMALRQAASNLGERRPFVGFGDPIFMADAAPAKQRNIRFRDLAITPAKDETISLVEQAKQSAKPLGNLRAISRPTLAQAFSLLAPLPDTAEELKDIAQSVGADLAQDLFLGVNATESRLKATDLSRYRVIAFATHGLIPGELSGQDQPALAMANPALTGDTGNDGFFTLEEVLGLKLNAEWVILSACNTASPDGNASEAISGLGRGFFFAGTRSLLVSNWAVETVSARLLTTGVFRQQANHPQMGRAEALRQSMLDLMRNPGEAYGHPVFWAPFSLVGDGLST